MAWTDEAREAALRARAAKSKDPGERNQLKIAADTLRMPDAMAGVMGGPSKDQARSLAESAHPSKSQPVPVHLNAWGQTPAVAKAVRAQLRMDRRMRTYQKAQRRSGP